MESQITSNIIMVRPAAFGYNAETAANNTFQHAPEEDQQTVSKKALAEFDQLVNTIRSEGVNITVFQDTPDPVKPDAVFPNNWVSFHSEGTVVTYPMFAELRRHERSDVLVHQLSTDFHIAQKIAFEGYEDRRLFLEGTGSMVLDRVNRVAYACISPRTDEIVLKDWCQTMKYTPFTFHARYGEKDIYHTNVMMAIGEGIAVVCLEVVEASRREALYNKLAESGHEVVLLRADQIGSFAGNMLAVANQAGEQLMLMSRQALDSLDADQIVKIESFARIVAGDIHTIESVGGGSVRCMIAENFLPRM
jgi:hypothetical protein